jgi:hypothetical protein
MLWGCLYSPNLLELDFSHLRAKGLEIRSSPQCATSSDQGAYPPPTDHNDAVYDPSPHFSKSTPLPIPPGLLCRETFCGSLRQTDMQKVPRAFVEGLTEAVSYTA